MGMAAILVQTCCFFESPVVFAVSSINFELLKTDFGAMR